MSRGEKVFLRRLEERDLEILAAWENDPESWSASDFSDWAPDEKPPYSRDQLARFICVQKLGPEVCGQARWVICVSGAEGKGDSEDAGEATRDSGAEYSGSDRDAVRSVGFIDLFDYDGAAASVGVLIYAPDDRGRGYTTAALKLLCENARRLGIRVLNCTVPPENTASRRLFEKAGFTETSPQNFTRAI